MKKLITICAAVLVVASMLCYSGFATASVTTNVYVDSMSLDYTTFLPETAPNGMWYQIEHWASTAEAKVAGGTFVNMSNTAYPGTTNMSIYDSVVKTSGTTAATGKAIVWLFDITTDTDINSIRIRGVGHPHHC